MAKNQHQDWAEAQINALIDAGIDPMDAQVTVNRILAKLPRDADPATWIPPTPDSTITQADIADARADWYASDEVAPRWKRILDAVEDEP